jgi:hypothetical protein
MVRWDVPMSLVGNSRIASPHETCVFFWAVPSFAKNDERRFYVQNCRARGSPNPTIAD